MVSKSIALLLPYFGKLPNYFQLWLDSAENNEDFTFLLLTDDDVFKYHIPENVIIQRMTLDDVRHRVSRILNYKFELSRAYKICDYRPLYGLIFEDYINGFDFWGHCDPDIIWGCLCNYINDNILENFDKIYISGHLSIIRNEKRINYLPLKESKDCWIHSRHVYTSKYSAHYDESPLIINNYIKNGVRIFSKIDCADVLYLNKNFIIKTNKGKLPVCYFVYEHGRIYGYNEKKERIDEYSYLHLQKRTMMDLREKPGDKDYVIVPNMFINMSNIAKDVKEYSYGDKDYLNFQKKLLRKRRIENITNGAIKFRILGLLNLITSKFYENK